MEPQETSYQKILMEDIGLQKDGPTPLDLYVLLHTSGRHHPIIKKGELLGEAHWNNLLRLQGSNIFVLVSEFEVWKSENKPSPQDLLNKFNPPAFEGEVLGADAKVKLNEIYLSLVNDKKANLSMGQTLISMSDKLIETLVPELHDARSMILKQLRHLHLMHQAAAISSLAILVALANGFESRSVFSNLSFSCMLMDAGLVELSEGELDLYYSNRNELPVHIMDRIRFHPLKATQILSNFKEANETVVQLILNHHELHNGKGYHRGVRTSSLSSLARSLSYAVDLYEHVKASELRKEKVGLGKIILALSEKNVPVHERRHSSEISSKIAEYLKL